MQPAVTAVDLVLGYGSHTVLEPSTFTVPCGKVTALIGPNGAGKSTLLDAIAGLLRPWRGSLEILCEVPGTHGRHVAYVPQSTKVPEQLPVTVGEVVTMGRFDHHGLLGRLDAADRALVGEAMARMEISDLARRRLTELSGGQRQRVFVAQGLAQRGEILLLDEPVTGLDLVSRRIILDVVRAEADAGRTVVMTTHDLGEANLADHLILLAGRVVASGMPSAVLTAANLAEAYGGRVLRLDDGRILLDDVAHTHSHAHG